MNKAFIYSDSFGGFSYGGDHPMRPMRLRATYDLISSLSLLDAPGIDIVEARAATDDEILSFHTEDYLKALKKADNGITPASGPEHALGLGDNPVFKGVCEWSALGSGASIQAAELVNSGKADVAFNIAGGLHHAMADHASGFCYLNDPVLAINYLLAQDKRVAYVDIDAHHGDGVQGAFYDTDRVLTISIHESGKYLFPGTGFTDEIGEGEGRGYSVNLPLPQSAGDKIFLEGFKKIVPRFLDAFKPDILVTQLGVDTMRSDPITHLQLTTNGFEEMVRFFKSSRIPWVALGGGGYDLSNVARNWTLAWAIMADIQVDDLMPENLDFTPELKEILGNENLRLRDELDLVAGSGQIETELKYLKEEVLPLILKS
jgi:acetoin utilization protein AcuC